MSGIAAVVNAGSRTGSLYRPVEVGPASHGVIDTVLQEWRLHTEDLRRLATRAVERAWEG